MHYTYHNTSVSELILVNIYRIIEIIDSSHYFVIIDISVTI